MRQSVAKKENTSEKPIKIKIPHPKLISIDKLKPHPNNVKLHPEEQIKNLMQLMKWVGFKDPVVIDKDGEVKAGHGRIEAAKRLGMKEIPWIPLEGLTKKQMDLFIIMDNKINESPWDLKNVELIMEDMPMKDLELFEVDWDGMIKPKLKEESEEVPEVPEKPKAKLGMIFHLGNHRLMCGDSTKDLDKLVDTKMDILLTDPPYGINAVNVKGVTGGGGKLGFKDKKGTTGGGGIVKARQWKPIEGDDEAFNPKFLLKLAKLLIIFGANNFANKLPNNARWLVWDKKTQDKSGSHTDTFSDVEMAWTNIDLTSSKIYRHLWSGLIRKGDRKTELTSRVHPTQKPVGLLSDIILDYSKKNNTVLDCYLGSGSTLIACEQTGRICYGMELDPGYIDVIIKRYINYKESPEGVFVIKNGKKVPYSL